MENNSRRKTSDNSDSNSNNQNDNDNSITKVSATPKSHLTSIFGYNIPISTLYFIIVLAIISVALYFLTGAKRKENKDKDKDKDKKKETD